MNLLRATAATAAGVWLGGIVLMAIVAQTTFSVMRTTGVHQPNHIAGQVMARNFSRFDVVQTVCAAALLIWQTAHMASGGTAWRDWARLACIVLAAGLLLYSARILTPRILDMQAAVAGVTDPEAVVRSAFDAFHRTAVRIAQVNLALVLAVVIEMAWPARLPDRPPGNFPVSSQPRPGTDVVFPPLP